MKYRVRTVKPAESDWVETEGASPEDAAQTYHHDHVGLGSYDIPRCIYRNEFEPDRFESVFFSKIEIEDHGMLFVRTYERGGWRIYRRGGVKPPRYENNLRIGSLEWIAWAIGWDRPVTELLEPRDLEETWEQADTRR
jgi:hypothetical protein